MNSTDATNFGVGEHISQIRKKRHLQLNTIVRYIGWASTNNVVSVFMCVCISCIWVSRLSGIKFDDSLHTAANQSTVNYDANN